MNKIAFILMPFAEEFSDVYQYLISEGLESAGYTVKRADDIKSQNNIIGDIVEGIISCDLLIADLTGSNPNVYYELGIAHALNKKVILITQDIDDLPFDLRSYRVISYSVHFTKMNQAKKELSDLAVEAFNNTLPFGNPVKDFGNIHLSPIDMPQAPNSKDLSDNNELGALDFRVNLEEGFEKISEIITEVGSKLVDEVTPQISKATDKLNSNKYTTKQQRNIVRELSGYLQEYGAFIKPKNLEYRELLKDIESSLEYLLSVEVEDEDVGTSLKEFIDVLSDVENSAFEGRQGFVSLIETMESIPKLEKSFDRAKTFMASELKCFVGNIDQTIAIISRAVHLGKSLIEKLHNKSSNLTGANDAPSS